MQILNSQILKIRVYYKPCDAEDENRLDYVTTEQPDLQYFTALYTGSGDIENKILATARRKRIPYATRFLWQIVIF